MNSVDRAYLAPTSLIDSDHPLIAEYASVIKEQYSDRPLDMAVALYYKVRDEIAYNPYIAYHLDESYRASLVIQRKKGYCVNKASLLCALARNCGIPARIGFVTVKNHLATRQLIELMGTDEFAYHGYSELYLNGAWIIATPAFDKATCERHGVEPLEFNGLEHSKYQEFNGSKKQFLQYLEEHGSYADIPVQQILQAFRDKYGEELVQKWIDAFNSMRGIAKRQFEKEEVVN